MNTRLFHSIFILAALLFWNPVAYHLFYSGTDVYGSTILRALFWALPVVGAVVIIAINKLELPSIAEHAILSLSSVGFFFGLAVAGNALVGVVMHRPRPLAVADAHAAPAGRGLIFESHSRARYHTSEFDIEAIIDSIGLRDREFPIDKGERFRILCFGDSWTFGWGVQVENSWPRKLEQYLRAAGYANVEVINAGRGGDYTTPYVAHMAAAVPLLKPDLVLVGVLQLDDLAQLFENKFAKDSLALTAPAPPQMGRAQYLRTTASNTASGVLHLTTTFLRASFSNVVAQVKNVPSAKRAAAPEVDIQQNWAATAREVIGGFDRLQTLRFHTLNDTVQWLFRSGNLNPSLLNGYIDFPDRTVVFNNPEHSKTQYAIREMDRDVKEMKRISDANHATLVFVNLPTNTFTGHIVVRTPSDILEPYFAQHNKIDSVYRAIATGNQLAYMQLTEYFTSLTDKTRYFFHFDGHPNEAGYQEIANYIGKQLVERKLLARN